MIIASVMILEKEGKVIFAKRSPSKKHHPNKWSLPAGKLEEGENPIEAARRETKEELGIEIINPEITETIEKKEPWEKILYLIKAEYSGIPTIVAKEELTELKITSFKEFFESHTDEDTGDVLQYLRKKYKEGNLW